MNYNHILMIRCPCCNEMLNLGYQLFPVRKAEEVEIDRWRKTSIMELKIGIRAHNRLVRSGYKTAGDVDAASDKQLLASDNFGKKSLKEVRWAIEELKREHSA